MLLISMKKRGPILNLINKWLATIQTTSVEPERRFSAAARACTNMNAKMGDNAINDVLLKFTFKILCVIQIFTGVLNILNLTKL